MGFIIDIFRSERDQFVFYLVLSAVIMVFAFILFASDRQIFVSHLGRLNPLISISILVLVGLFCFALLINGGWFTIFKEWDSSGYLLAFILSSIFFLVVLVLDWALRFPRDINILFPQSLMYYPVVGFVVNVLFHAVLVSILIFLLRMIFPGASTEATLWIAIGVTALVEPVYQMAAGAAADGWTWLVILTGVHVLLINLAQLYLFKRYDFATMYSMRLMYYLLWHIIWGMARLQILF